MKDFYLKISAQDRLRMERIVVDRDSEDAFALVRQWLETVAGAERGGMESHLDRTLPGRSDEAQIDRKEKLCRKFRF